ncbi:MAG: hypothetical protein VB084_05290 [Syntrophomonadaceae bacterium]|nr:hypothetical protein [Syntrophomonadaceae bacterium]
MDNSHASTRQPEADKNVKRRVPRSIFGIILVCFAALYWYAAYGDTPAPEKTVKNFYQAYFNRNFDVVAQNLSVFWSVRFLPDDYANMAPAELIENRPQIEEQIAAVIADIEKDTEIPQGVTVNIMKDYTKIGQKSAVVVYSFMENGKETGMEAAILIMEKGQFRIFNMSPIDETILGQVKDLDINRIDENFTELLNSPQSE